MDVVSLTEINVIPGVETFSWKRILFKNMCVCTLRVEI